MCGIAGIVKFNQPEEKKNLLLRMLGAIHYRGPDDTGILLDGPAALGNVRLSIVDLSGGRQPLSNEDGTIWVVFNGEIYNYPDLRLTLEEKGHHFKTRCDTEVLVHLYEEYGTELPTHLNGQFAFAIWDSQKRSLFLARDRMGIRPLYYHLKGSRLLFASEIKSLLMDNTIGRSIHPQTLGDVFCGWVPLGEETAFTQIQQLPPGHFAQLDANGLSTHRYWDLPIPVPLPDISEEQFVSELLDLLTDAVRIRLRSDVPVSAYLSGGLDSALISTLAQKTHTRPLKTFSVGFSDPRFDEQAYQQEALSFLGTGHHTFKCDYPDIANLFPRVIRHAESPVFRTAPAPLMHLAEKVRNTGIKVVLTGEGADELFAGYNIFKEDKVRRFWARDPESRYRPRLLEALYPYIFTGTNRRAKGYLRNVFKAGLESPDTPLASHQFRWRNNRHTLNFVHPDFLQGQWSFEGFKQRCRSLLPPDVMTWPPLYRAQFIEQKTFLPGYLLSTQGDRMAMAGSVEGRFPFLDHRLVEFSARLPQHLKLFGLTEKYILKKAAASLNIPGSIIQRPKQPYRAPMARTFFADGSGTPAYVDEMLSERYIQKTGYFHPARTRTLLKKCRHLKGELTSERENMALTGVLSTQLLHHLFIDNTPNPTPIPLERINLITLNEEQRP